MDMTRRETIDLAEDRGDGGTESPDVQTCTKYTIIVGFKTQGNIKNSGKRVLTQKEMIEQHTPAFLSMQLHYCMLITLHVQCAKNATVMIVTNIPMNLNL